MKGGTFILIVLLGQANFSNWTLLKAHGDPRPFQTLGPGLFLNARPF